MATGDVAAVDGYWSPSPEKPWKQGDLVNVYRLYRIGKVTVADNTATVTATFSVTQVRHAAGTVDRVARQVPYTAVFVRKAGGAWLLTSTTDALFVPTKS